MLSGFYAIHLIQLASGIVQLAAGIIWLAAGMLASECAEQLVAIKTMSDMMSNLPEPEPNKPNIPAQIPDSIQKHIKHLLISAVDAATNDGARLLTQIEQCYDEHKKEDMEIKFDE